MSVASLNPVSQALANAQAVRSLQACAGWQWLVGEMERDIAVLTQQVMDGDLTEAERDRLIGQYRTLKEILKRPEKALDGAQRVLSQQAAGLEDEPLPPD